FSLVFAIAGPILLSFTAKMERKDLFLITLFIFFLHNIFTYFSRMFQLVMITRDLIAACAALNIVLALTITARITISSNHANALEYIYMRISSSLVLGVPIGIVVTNVFGWRAIFLGIAILTIGSMILIIKYFEEIPAGTVQPLLEQLKA